MLLTAFKLFNHRRVLLACLSLVVLFVVAAPSAAQERQRLTDLFYGEALYHIYQDDFFQAIRILDHELAQHYGVDTPQQDSLYRYKANAELSVGELELNYRMHQQAGRALQRIFQENIDQATQNAAALRMARILFDKNQYVDVINALELIRGQQSAEFQADVVMLRGMTEMHQRNYSVAIELLQPLIFSDKHRDYALYNLGLSYLLSGDQAQGASYLEQLGAQTTEDKELLALQDKANLILGNRYLDEGYPQLAKPVLNRIRLDGPFSNQALLKAGWSAVALKDYEAAITPWSLLHERETTDIAVQEALLALPFAYSALESFGRAALFYGEAVDRLTSEIAKVDAAIAGVNDNRLLTALGEDDDRNHIRFLNNISKNSGIAELRYLFRLMASSDFNESVKNYRDLLFMKQTLEQLNRNIQAFNDLVSTRTAYYQPLIPQVEETFAVLDTAYTQALQRKTFLQERLALVQRLHDPRALATDAELTIEDAVLRLENRVSDIADAEEKAQTQHRLSRLKGVMKWQQDMAYEARLEQAYQLLNALENDLKNMQNTHAIVVNDKREAYQSFVGYEIQLRRLQTKLNSLLANANSLLRQQGRFINKAAIIELDTRRKKLSDYQTRARFALAESYDKATQKQLSEFEAQKRAENAANDNEAAEPNASAESPDAQASPTEAPPEAPNAP